MRKIEQNEVGKIINMEEKGNWNTCNWVPEGKIWKCIKGYKRKVASYSWKKVDHSVFSTDWYLVNLYGLTVSVGTPRPKKKNYIIYKKGKSKYQHSVWECSGTNSLKVLDVDIFCNAYEQTEYSAHEIFKITSVNHDNVNPSD